MTYPEFYRSSLSRSSIIVLFFFLSYVRADDLSFGPSLATLLGVCVCLVGGIVDNLGVTLQKISHGQRNENQTQNHSILDGHSSRGYWRNKTWLLGFSMYLGGNIVNAVGLGLAPQSVFAALGTFGLITNALTSRFILKEQLNSLIIFGGVFIMVGSALAVTFGTHGHDALRLHELRQNLTPLFLAWSGILILAIMLLIMYSRNLQRKLDVLCEFSDTEQQVDLDERKLDMSEATLSPKEEASMIFRDDAPSMVGIHTNHHIDMQKAKLGIIYPTMAGMLAAFTQLFTKVTSELIKDTINGQNEFVHFEIYLLIAGILAVGISQIHVLNMGLRCYDQLVVVPTFMVALEIFSVITGLIFFRGFQEFSTLQAVMFPFAILLNFFGVAVTVYGRIRLRDALQILPGGVEIGSLVGKYDESR